MEIDKLSDEDKKYLQNLLDEAEKRGFDQGWKAAEEQAGHKIA